MNCNDKPDFLLGWLHRYDKDFSARIKLCQSCGCSAVSDSGILETDQVFVIGAII